MLDLLSDQPTTEDWLGYEKIADVLGEIILSPTTETPFTIGVFGEWGSGKTSLLRMIEKHIQRTDCRTVWFDPWRYDEKHTIQKALIRTILAKIDYDASSDAFRGQVADLAVKFVALITAKTVEIGTHGIVKPFELYENAREKIKPKFEDIRAWNELDREFASVVETYVGKDGRLVVFIDDLDRCLPENAIQVLEAIKLFLAQKHCIFILSVDKKGIEDAISLRYKDTQMSGVNYLEKIIQLPFFLPLPQPDNIKSYMEKICGANNKSYQTQQIVDAGTGGNPRRIKRFFNALTLLQSIAPDEKLQQGVLAKLVMLHLRFPDFYKLLCSDHDAIDKLLRLYNGQKITSTLNTKIYDEFVQKPQLVNFLVKTQDINPDDELWVRYLYLTDIVKV